MSEDRRGTERRPFDAAIAAELKALRRGFWTAPLASALAAIPILAGAWGVLDWIDARPVLSRELHPIAQSIAEIQRNQSLQRWQMLNMRRINNGSLSPEDQVEFCAISASLGIQGVGCA
jgi:hypothetical protein